MCLKEFYRPPLEQFEFAGVWCPLEYVIPITLKETLKLVDDYKPSLDNPDSLELFGLIIPMYDGSGSHYQMRGDEIDIPTTNIVLGKCIWFSLYHKLIQPACISGVTSLIVTS